MLKLLQPRCIGSVFSDVVRLGCILAYDMQGVTFVLYPMVLGTILALSLACVHEMLGILHGGSPRYAGPNSQARANIVMTSWHAVYHRVTPCPYTSPFQSCLTVSWRQQ